MPPIRNTLVSVRMTVAPCRGPKGATPVSNAQRPARWQGEGRGGGHSGHDPAAAPHRCGQTQQADGARLLRRAGATHSQRISTHRGYRLWPSFHQWRRLSSRSKQLGWPRVASKAPAVGATKLRRHGHPRSGGRGGGGRVAVSPGSRASSHPNGAAEPWRFAPSRVLPWLRQLKRSRTSSPRTAGIPPPLLLRPSQPLRASPDAAGLHRASWRPRGWASAGLSCCWSRGSAATGCNPPDWHALGRIPRTW